jgi:integrase
MRDLLAHAKKMGGTIRHTGLRRSIYWESFLRLKWELGLRVGDMIRLKVSDYNGAGWLWVEEKKTGKSGWRHLEATTASALELCIGLKPSREVVWEGYAPKGVYKAFKRLATRAKRPGTSRFVRRGAASEVDAKNPGQGWMFLRHSTPTLFPRHYRVGKICDRNPLRPPGLGI